MGLDDGESGSEAAERPVARKLQAVPEPESDPDQDYQELAEEWAAELAILYPDPVDIFEDNLASELGLHRYPGLSLGAWRRLRVDYINDVAGES